METARENLNRARALLRADDIEGAIELAGDALRAFVDAGEDVTPRELAAAHFAYGEALFRGAQASNTVFGESARAGAEASGARLEDGEASGEDDGAGEDEAQGKDGDSEGEDAEEGENEGDENAEEESDMELAWTMLETARVTYEDKCPDAPLELADVLETIGELNMEQSQFDGALGDYKKALALLEANLEPTDRRLASALYSISIANQMLESNDDALAANTRAIEICEARIADLKAGTARVSKGARERAGELVKPEDAIRELEQIMGVASDLKERQLELQELVSADNSTREALRAAFKAIGGAAPPGASAEESTGFAAPTLGTSQPVQAAPIRKVLPAPVRKVEVAPLREAPIKRVEPQQTAGPIGEPEAKKMKPTQVEKTDKGALLGATAAPTDAEPNGCPQQ